MTTLNVQQLSLLPGVTEGALTMRVTPGEVAALFGRPDSGTREALRIIAGLDRWRGGDVRLGEVPVHGLPAHRRRIGLVQRNSVLFPGTVEQNVAFGLRQAKWPKGDRGRRIAEVLELVGMTGAERDPVDVLTEGERARVILARAIAPRPAALLVESPTWFVPEVDRIGFRSRLREVYRSLEIPVVISTTDVEDAVGIADDLYVLHEGVLRQSGSVSRVLAGPNSIEVAELVGYVTIVRGEVRDGWILEPGAGAVEFPAGFPLRGSARALGHPAVMLGVPEDSGLGCGVAGTVERVRATGPTYLLDLRVGERTIAVRWEWDLNPPELDDAIAIAVTPGTLRYFNEPARPALRGDDVDASAEEPLAPRRARTARATSTATATNAATNTVAPAPDASSDRDAPPEEPAPDATPDATPEGEEAPPATTTTAAAAAGRSEETSGLAFRPSDGLLAELAPSRAEAPRIAYDPDEGGAPGEQPSRPPAPAPAPPRESAARSTPESSNATMDTTTEAMPPWLQVSKPREDEDAPDSPKNPHRGMPLD